MKYVTTLYDKEKTPVTEIDGILPIRLEKLMTITIDGKEVKISSWEYLFETKDQKFELRIFLTSRWSGQSFLATGQEPK